MNKKIVDQIKIIATKKGCTLTQIALAWVAAQGFISIPGTTKPQRLEENWGSRYVDLTEGDLQELRKIIDENKPAGNRVNDEHRATLGH